MSPVCIKAYAVAEGENKKDPSLDWSFRSIVQSSPDIPSRLCNIVVGTLCIMSFGILQHDTTKLKKGNFPEYLWGNIH